MKKTRCFLALAATALLHPAAALAGPEVPAQPVTDLRKPTAIDASGDADPFNIVQLDDRLLFIARNNGAYALYVRNLMDPANVGSPDPAIEWTTGRLRPRLLKPFPRTQAWDGHLRNVARVDVRSIGEFRSRRPTEGTLFFHVPKRGLFSSKGTALTTRALLDVDLAPDNGDGRWLDFLTSHRDDEPGEGRAFFAGEGRGRGVELFVATAGARPRARLFANVAPGAADSSPQHITSSFQTIYFAAIDPAFERSYAIYKSDGVNPPTVAAGELLPPTALAADGSGGLYFAASDAPGGGAMLFYIDAAGQLSPITTDAVNPQHLTPTGHGAAILFSGETGTGREVWIAAGAGATVLHNINSGRGGSDPAQFTATGGGYTYFSASDGDVRALYRSDTLTLEPLLEETTDAPILFDAQCEIMPVIDRGLGTWVYFTGTPQGGAERLLYRIDDTQPDARAIRVLTPDKRPVRNARNLGKFVSPGLGLYRLYFSCDGAGTEFSDASATELRFRPRGFELWCTEVGF